MSAALDPLRHVYDVEPPGPLDGAARVEANGLRGVRDLLERRPALAPTDLVIGHVLARAAEASGLGAAPDLAESPVEAAVIAQSAGALDRLPRSRPSDAVIGAVQSFAASVLEEVPARSSVEQAVIVQSQMVLDRMPRVRPSAEAVMAIEAVAAQSVGEVVPTQSGVEEVVVAQSQDVLGRMPRARPLASVVAVVEARAAEASGLGAAPDLAESPVEAAVIAQSAGALDRLPRSRPSDAVIAAIEARAAQATDALGAVRSVYADGPAVESVEAMVLSQSRQIVERAVASRPRPRPDAEAVAAVLVRAVEASGLAAEPSRLGAEVGRVEGAVIVQSLGALDRLPRPRPEAATLDAVRLAAATATGAASAVGAPQSSPRPASVDRAAIRESSRRGFPAVWAGASALVMAAVAAFFLLPTGSPAEAPASVALADAADGPALEAEAVPEVEPEPEPATSTAPSGSALVAAAGVSSMVPVPESSSRPAPRPAPTAAVAPSALAAEPVRQARTETPPSTSVAARPTPARAAPASWDAGDDVRALSLRLQELDDDLAWDTPAEAFGVPAASAAGTAGVQAVRAGAPARARFRSAPDSTQR